MPRIHDHPMLRLNTPIEYYPEYDLYIKREDLACFPPGPPFSKTRGVYAHIASKSEKMIGVLDTYHSQAGHAVARACQVLGKRCINFYPEFKNEPGPRPPQLRAKELGASLHFLKAGRSAILYHQARKIITELGGYMMPNALKLEESVEETAKEVPTESFNYVLVPCSSGTIAAGVIRGFMRGSLLETPHFILHLGYDRSESAFREYIKQSAKVYATITVVNEGYAYKDKAKPGLTPPWPCNEYYDLKAFRWLINNRQQYQGKILLWNIG